MRPIASITFIFMLFSLLSCEEGSHKYPSGYIDSYAKAKNKRVSKIRSYETSNNLWLDENELEDDERKSALVSGDKAFVVWETMKIDYNGRNFYSPDYSTKDYLLILEAGNKEKFIVSVNTIYYSNNGLYLSCKLNRDFWIGFISNEDAKELFGEVFIENPVNE